MSKLRYGTRYDTTVEHNYTPDHGVVRDLREDNERMARFWDAKPQYLHEQATHRAQATKRRKKAALGTGRQDAELRMVDALREAVKLLEFSMADMTSHKVRPGDHCSVNQLQIANALYHLKHKCGIGFDDASYNTRVPLYEYEPSLLPQKDANLDERLKAQREARIRRRQRIIDKLIARPKGHP